MVEDVAAIGWRPILIGTVVLLIGSVAGWGMAGDRSFAPANWLRWWMVRFILPGLRHRFWLARLGVIFLNNATICALTIAAGALPAGAWAAVVLLGLSLGTGMRMLTDPRWEIVLPEAPEAAAEPEQPPALDRVAALGILVNMLELPAIALTLGLAMGRGPLPNHLAPEAIWRIYACWIAPLLLIAAGGEALWLGRRRPF